MNKTQIGTQAEKRALTFLQKQQDFQKLIFQNYKRLPHGEIDLIVIIKDVLVFVEVKMRKNANFGTASEMVNIKKHTIVFYHYPCTMTMCLFVCCFCLWNWQCK